ncbi:MAG: YgeY family selenium metabolism-linked hydrolase [Proteobacteria bacterium]|nr:YgeY family selenium metabolism-linked hydrolase [Pseudomonadota bacterium]
MALSEILKKAESLEGPIAGFLAEIVSIRSPSCGEKRAVERVCAEMRAVGFDDVRVDRLGSAIGRIGSGKKKIAIDAHIDTVGEGDRSLWNFDPFKGFVKDGRVWGRGSADQKGGAAAMVYAGKLIRDLALEGDYTLHCTATVMEEDCDGLCWKHLIEEENLRPDVCVITEPTGLNIYRGQRGRMEIEARVAGLSAHGSAPGRGVNAIYRMAPLIREIEGLNEKLRDDAFLGRGTVVMSDIRSTAPSLCSVADSCTVYLDRRLTAGETRESAVAEIEAIIKKADGSVRVPRYETAAYTGLIYPMDKYFPSWVVPEDHPAVAAAKAAHRSLFGSNARVGRWTFSTNGVSICGMHGIPCVGFGPGFEEQAHAPNEWTPVEHLWKAAAFYAAFVSAFGSRI